MADGPVVQTGGIVDALSARGDAVETSAVQGVGVCAVGGGRAEIGELVEQGVFGGREVPVVLFGADGEFEVFFCYGVPVLERGVRRRRSLEGGNSGGGYVGRRHTL